eukprot:c32231_g1_i1 orf=32-262(-)
MLPTPVVSLSQPFANLASLQEEDHLLSLYSLSSIAIRACRVPFQAIDHLPCLYPLVSLALRLMSSTLSAMSRVPFH